MKNKWKLITDRPFYNSFAWAYDSLTNKPVEKICDFVKEVLIQNNIQAGDFILDAGCGTGNYAINLAGAGYNVTGIDLSPSQINQAVLKSKNSKLPVVFKVGNFVEDIDNKKYNAALCRGVLNDIIDDESRDIVFKKFASFLQDSGILIFDVRNWLTSKEAKLKKPISKKIIDGKDFKLTFISKVITDDTNESLLINETHIIEKDGIETKRTFDTIMKCWKIDELDIKLKEAGFKQINYYGDYDFNIEPGATEKIICTAVK